MNASNLDWLKLRVRTVETVAHDLGDFNVGHQDSAIYAAAHAIRAAHTMLEIAVATAIKNTTSEG